MALLSQAAATSFTRQDIASLDGAIGVIVDDVNGDGYNDVVAGGYYADKIVLLKNLNNSGSFAEITVATGVINSVSVFAMDVSNDSHVVSGACLRMVRAWRVGC